MFGRIIPLGLALALACGGGDPSTGTDGGSSTTSGAPGTTGSTGVVTTSGATSGATSGTGSTGAVDDSGGRVDMFAGECKDSDATFPLDQECMSYSYVDGGLTITHVNAALNCCVEQVDAAIKVVDTAIEIAVTEAEGFMPCNCNCLFNVDYVFDALPVGTYTVTLASPYVPMGDPPLTHELNLQTTPIGAICVERSAYPWMM